MDPVAGLFPIGACTGCGDDSVAPSSLPYYQAYFPIDSGTGSSTTPIRLFIFRLMMQAEVDTAAGILSFPVAGSYRFRFH